MSRSLFDRSWSCAAVLAALCAAAPLTAQTPSPAAPQAGRSKAQDPAERLRAMLPADVAERILAIVAQARAHQLPAEALEGRALKFAMRGENPAAIERAVRDHSVRLAQSQTTLSTARGGRPTNDEVEAGAEAIRQGVDGATVSALAKSAPSGRSLAVPLYVLGELAARGLPSDDALARVKERLAAKASDAELEQLPTQAIGRGNKPAEVGRDVAGTRRPANVGGGAGTAGGPPSGVPANAGAGGRPAGAGRPSSPGNRP